MPNYSPKGVVPVSGYGWTVFNATADTSLATAYVEHFIQHRRSRIRQSGTMRRAQFYTGNLAGIASVKVRVWRWTGITYILVGASENILARLTASTVNLVDLTSPIVGVLEGDYVSLQFTCTPTVAGALALTTTTANKASLRSVTSDPGTLFNWDGASTTADRIIQIRLYSDAPTFIFIGDSQITGSNEHRTFIEDRDVSEANTVTDVHGTFEFQFYRMSGFTYQNMGNGGEGSADTLARIAADAIDLQPHYIVVQSGWNEVRTGSTDQAAFITRLTSMRTLVEAAGINFIYMQGAPLTVESNAHHQTFDAWMVAALALLGSTKFLVQRDLVGMFRVGGDANNLWDWKTGYGHGDGLHPVNAGKMVVAYAVWRHLGFARRAKLSTRDGYPDHYIGGE